jgi:hypothetical protein
MAALYVSPFLLMKHDFSTCAAVARTYETKRDFRAGSNKEFQWLLRNNLGCSVLSHDAAATPLIG